MLPPAASTVRRGAAAAASGSPSPEMLDHAHRGQVGGVAARSDADWTKDAGCRRIQTQQRWITVHSRTALVQPTVLSSSGSREPVVA